MRKFLLCDESILEPVGEPFRDGGEDWQRCQVWRQDGYRLIREGGDTVLCEVLNGLPVVPRTWEVEVY